jgi:hypothetical protein
VLIWLLDLARPQCTTRDPACRGGYDPTGVAGVVERSEVALFWQRHLEPVESLGEVLFGLIMALTFTLGAAVSAGYDRELILGAVGCNVAWGIIDGVLFMLSTRFERRLHRLASCDGRRATRTSRWP